MAKAKKTTKAKPGVTVNDVAHPDTTAPTDTSRPIITRRPIMKDPMVVEGNVEKGAEAGAEGDEEKKPISETAEKPLTRKTGGLKIIPTTDITDSTAKTDPTDTTAGEDKDKSGKMPDLPITAEATEPEEDTKAPESAKSETTAAKPEEPAEETAETDEKPATEESAPEEKTEDQTNKKTKKSDAAAESAAKAAKAAEEAKLQKLIESKKYFLPINQVEQRRSKHFAIMGILIALVLVVAWADVALDAGLVKINGVKPLTHFFSN